MKERLLGESRWCVQIRRRRKGFPFWLGGSEEGGGRGVVALLLVSLSSLLWSSGLDDNDVCRRCLKSTTIRSIHSTPLGWSSRILHSSARASFRWVFGIVSAKESDTVGLEVAG